MTTSFFTDQASIAAFNRGPVTSIFAPPTSCLSVLTYGPAMYFGYAGQSPYFDVASFPSSTLTPAPTTWDVYYYSPARCPSGWSQATQLTSSFGQGSVFLSVDLPPRQCSVAHRYFYDTSNADIGCKSVFTSTTTTLLYITPIESDSTWYSTNANAPSTTTVAVGDTAYAVFGSGIPVWWQSSDLAAFSSATEAPSTSTTSSHTSSPTNSLTTTPTPKPSGLSSGAKIGIGIGIPLAFIAVPFAAFFVYIRRRRRRHLVPQIEPQDPLTSKPELQDTSTNRRPFQEPHLLDGAVIHEMGSENQPSHEMYSDDPPSHEMGSDNQPSHNPTKSKSDPSDSLE